MTRMEKHPLFQSAYGEVAQAAAVFAFPELFSADMRLLLDIETHTALFISLQGREALPLIRRALKKLALALRTGGVQVIFSEDRTTSLLWPRGKHCTKEKHMIKEKTIYCVVSLSLIVPLCDLETVAGFSTL